jgi:hypothetical protein
MTGDAVPETAAAKPALRIVQGDATPEEIAALVAVLGAGSGSGDQAARRAKPVNGWASPAQVIRRPLLQGPGAWSASAWR